jgi:hypothetical protein
MHLTEALLVGSKEVGLETNADKTIYMVMSLDQNSGRSHNIKIHNSSFERVEEFKCLETTLMYQNSIQEQIKSILTSGNACYQSVQHFLSSICYPKIERLRYTELRFCLLFCMGVKLVHLH